MVPDYLALKKTVLDTAKRCAVRRLANQKTVLDEVASAAGGNLFTPLPLDLQQAILTCWHDLFREGELSWGLNLDNPDPPFFHIPDRACSV